MKPYSSTKRFPRQNNKTFLQRHQQYTSNGSNSSSSGNISIVLPSAIISIMLHVTLKTFSKKKRNINKQAVLFLDIVIQKIIINITRQHIIFSTSIHLFISLRSFYSHDSYIQPTNKAKKEQEIQSFFLLLIVLLLVQLLLLFLLFADFFLFLHLFLQ